MRPGKKRDGNYAGERRENVWLKRGKMMVFGGKRGEGREGKTQEGYLG